MHVVVYSRRDTFPLSKPFICRQGTLKRVLTAKTNSQKFGDDIRDTYGKTRGRERKVETSGRRKRNPPAVASKYLQRRASGNLYTRVARLIKRSQSKPKLIAVAARTACPGMGRAMREIRRNLGIRIGIAGTSPPLYRRAPV